MKQDRGLKPQSEDPQIWTFGSGLPFIEGMRYDRFGLYCHLLVGEGDAGGSAMPLELLRLPGRSAQASGFSPRNEEVVS